MNDLHPLEPLARRWNRLSKLSAAEIAAALDLPYARKTYGKDSYIVRDGQPTSDCSVLLRGFAFRQKLLRNGTRQIISFHIPGEFVDLQNSLLPVADHSVQSLDRTETAIIPREALLAASDNYPGLRKAMWIETLLDASIFREWVINVGRRDSRARIAHLLCELAIRLDAIGAGNNGRFDFPITQEQLADATGLTSVHTNRTLQSLRKDGLIELGARALTILNWNDLREAGDFDELYLHHKV